jgi:hypothetical protein
MNRIESIISSGRSFDRIKDENFNPFTTKSQYLIDQSTIDRRGAVSPIPSLRTN